MTVYSAALLLFLVMDPLGNIPPFLTVLKNVDEGRQKKIIIRELIIALLVLVFFLFFGQFLLQLMNISGPSLGIAGGIVLFLIAIKMIFPGTGALSDMGMEGEPFIVPLAIPLVAGPSALASVLLVMSRAPERWPEWLAALVVAWVATGIILFMSSGLRKFFGKRGLIAMERLMGMVLTVIAVQMFMDGLSEFLTQR